MPKRRKQNRRTADRKAAVVRAWDTEPKLVALLPLDDLYVAGDVALIVPGLWSGLPADVLDAVIARRVADLTGECPICGGCSSASEQFWHEYECPATNERLSPALQDFRPEDLGERLVDPTPRAGPFDPDGRRLVVVDPNGRATGEVVVIRFERVRS